MNNNKEKGIFVRPDGKPFLFCMLKNRLFGELASLIEENGGKLVPLGDKNVSWNQMMTLLSDDDSMVEEFKNKDRLLFHCRFVTESCEDKVLKNPMIYRVPRQYDCKIHDEQQVLQVLFGEKTWSDFLPKKKTPKRIDNLDLSGEICSDIEEIIVNPFDEKAKTKTLRKRAPKSLIRSEKSRRSERQLLRDSTNVDLSRDQTPNDAANQGGSELPIHSKETQSKSLTSKDKTKTDAKCKRNSKDHANVSLQIHTKEKEMLENLSKSVPSKPKRMFEKKKQNKEINSNAKESEANQTSSESVPIQDPIQTPSESVPIQDPVQTPSESFPSREPSIPSREPSETTTPCNSSNEPSEIHAESIPPQEPNETPTKTIPRQEPCGTPASSIPSCDTGETPTTSTPLRESNETPSKSFRSQEKPLILKKLKKPSTVFSQNLTNKKKSPQIREHSKSPSGSNSFNEAHSPSPFKHVRQGLRIRLFNQGKSGPERINDHSDEEERGQRVQAVAAKVISSQISSLEDSTAVQARLTKAYDTAKRKELRPVLDILDILVEYELLNELSLDSTWKFVYYFLHEDGESLISYKDLKAKFFIEMLPTVLTDFTQGLAPFYHKLDNTENRLHRRYSGPQTSIDSDIEKRMMDILVGQNLFELESDVVWKIINITVPLEGYSHQEIRGYFFKEMLPRIDTFKSNFDMKEFQDWKSQSLPKEPENDPPEEIPMEVNNSSLDESFNSEQDEQSLSDESLIMTPKKRPIEKEKNARTKKPREPETDDDFDTNSETTELRKPYSRNEDIKIIHYIIKTSRGSEVNGLKLWRDMERRNILPRRTHQSLKERFRRRILPKIHSFRDNFSKEELTKLKKEVRSRR